MATRKVFKYTEPAKAREAAGFGVQIFLRTTDPDGQLRGSIHVVDTGTGTEAAPMRELTDEEVVFFAGAIDTVSRAAIADLGATEEDVEIEEAVAAEVSAGK